MSFCGMMLRSTQTFVTVVVWPFIAGVDTFTPPSTRHALTHRRRRPSGLRRLPSPTAAFAVSGRRPAVGDAVGAAVTALTRRPGLRRSGVRRHTTASRRKTSSYRERPRRQTMFSRRRKTGVDTSSSIPPTTESPAPEYFQSTTAVTPPLYRQYACEKRLRPTLDKLKKDPHFENTPRDSVSCMPGGRYQRSRHPPVITFL